MGRPKLLMPWRGTTVLDCVLQAWSRSTVDRTVVVVWVEDESLRRIVRNVDVDVVLAETRPPDMKASVRLGLEHLRRRYAPRDADSWLLAPADMPNLTCQVIDHVVQVWRETPAEIVVPCCAGRRGHPVAFAWRLAAEVNGLSPEEGINILLARHAIHPTDWSEPSVWQDVDSPEDYDRLR